MPSMHIRELSAACPIHSAYLPDTKEAELSMLEP